MNAMTPEFLEGFDNPLDGLAEILNDNQWPFDRPADDRMNFDVDSGAGHFRFALLWNDQDSSMTITCDPSLTIHKNCNSMVYALLNRVNTDLHVGAMHIDAEGALTWRYTTLFRGISASGADHVEAIVDIAVEQFESYLPVFSSYQQPASIANDNPGHQMDLGLILARTIGNA